jgi:hypothetical protein
MTSPANLPPNFTMLTLPLDHVIPFEVALTRATRVLSWAH